MKCICNYRRYIAFCCEDLNEGGSVVKKEELYNKCRKFMDSTSSHLSMFDNVDRKIVRCLLENPRTTLRDIAKSVGVTRTTVRNRLKKLFDNKCITTKVLFNVEKCDFRFAFLGLSFSRFRDFNRCLQIAMYCPRVVILVKNVNKYHILMVLIAESDEELCHIINEFQFLSGVKETRVETITAINLLKPIFIESVPFIFLDSEEIRSICDSCPMNLYSDERSYKG